MNTAPSCGHVCADYPVDYGKRGEAGALNDHCSGGCLRLAGSRGGHSSIAAQEHAKNVASGADHAAEQAEAQGRTRPDPRTEERAKEKENRRTTAEGLRRSRGSSGHGAFL